MRLIILLTLLYLINKTRIVVIVDKWTMSLGIIIMIVLVVSLVCNLKLLTK